MIGTPEIIIILIIIVLLFGAKKIPELFKGVGEGIKELKKAASSIEEEKEAIKENVDKIVNKEDQ